jgi:hypothetical protein
MKKMNKIFFVICLVLITFNMMSINVFAQEHDEAHHHPENEVGIAVGAVPLVDEDKIAAGLHFHYIRGIAFEHKLGIGAGFEAILDEHKHYVVSVVFQYRIYKGWTVAYAPGIMMKKEEGNLEYHFAQHFETAYEFELGEFHLGPMVEVGVSEEGVHYMLGAHFGIAF